MKKSLVLSILALTAAVSSYGQGSIAFDTYNAQSFAGIITTYGSGPLAGTGLGSTFTGVLLWSSVAINESATTGPVDAGSVLNPLWNIASTAFFNTGAATGPGGLGYVTGPNATLPTTGTIWFEIAAYTGASYATGTFAGHSASFQATLVTGSTLPNANQLNNMPAWQVQSVNAVPEPTTLALAGLGGLASLVMLRRKKA